MQQLEKQLTLSSKYPEVDDHSISKPQRNSHEVSKTEALEFAAMKKQNSEDRTALERHFEDTISLFGKSTCADSDSMWEEKDHLPAFDVLGFARLICNPK